MEEELFTIKDLGRHAESMLEMVFVQHDRIEERLKVQDVQFKRLWDAKETGYFQFQRGCF